MDKIWKRAFFNEHKKAQQQIVILENEYGDFNPKWTEPAALTSKVKPGPRGFTMQGLGVYNIIYGPTEIVMYTGQGVVSHRKSAHKMIFKNEGKVIVHAGGTRTDSPVARKMFDYDPNLDNWSDCGSDMLCPNNENYLAPDDDGTELNGLWDENEGRELNNLHDFS